MLFIIQQRSPKINTFTNKRSRLSTNQQHQTAIAPNLNHKAIAQNIHTCTTQAIAPQQPTTSNSDCP
ncbi:MAG: hypothetical protein ACK54E_03780 [Pseudanabaena sp.]